MPARWRVLFGVQGMVMFIAVNIRLSDIERARRIAAEKEAASVEQTAAGEGDAVHAHGTVLGKRGATIVTRTTTGVERRRENI